jgi:tRNA G18 (ribose-2'-O)-methylase SpoU
MRIDVESFDDPRLAEYRALRDRELVGDDGRSGTFIGEGLLVIERMLALPGATRSILAAERRLAEIDALLARHAQPHVPVFVTPDHRVEALTGFQMHRGAIASGDRAILQGRSLLEIAPTTGPALVLAADGVGDRDNIGAIFRDGAAFGAHGILIGQHCHDPLYRKSIRSSMGYALSVPFLHCVLPSTLKMLRRDHGYSVLGTVCRPGARPLPSIRRTERMVVVVGNEFRGISPEVEAECDQLAFIPMREGIDSLNVSVAGAVTLFHLAHGSGTLPNGNPSGQA